MKPLKMWWKKTNHNNKLKTNAQAEENQNILPVRRSTRAKKQRKSYNLSHYTSGYSKAVDKIEKRHNLEYKVNHLVTQGNMTDRLEYDFEMAQVIGKVFNVVQTYALNKGVKKFIERGYEAAFKEVEQLHKRIVFELIHVNKLTPQE